MIAGATRALAKECEMQDGAAAALVGGDGGGEGSGGGGGGGGGVEGGHAGAATFPGVAYAVKE